MSYCVEYGVQYADEASCLAACSTWEVGVDGDTTGNTVYCRIYHANEAHNDPATHCPHAQEVPEDICV